MNVLHRYAQCFARRLLLVLLLGYVGVVVPVAQAAMLSFVSDTISTSAPASNGASHTILFTVTATIPAGGKIIITPEPGAFTIPALLDETDLDLALSTSSGIFVDRTLAATPSATADGASVVSGTSGSLTITLGSGASSSIAAGSIVRIIIGGAASFGGAGDQFITNPSMVGTYHMRFVTTDAAGGALDYGSTLVVILAPVSMGPVDTTDTIPPLRTNGLPTGLLPASTANVLVSLNTNKLATCRYATSSGVAYASMLLGTTFTAANAGLLHYQNIAVAPNTIYNLFVRCVNSSGNTNPDDYLITFEIGVVPTVSAPPPPPPGGGGASGGGGGGGGLFLKSGEVTLEGKAVPNSTLVILQDGKIVRERVVDALGAFSEKFSSLERGLYTWGVYMRDADSKHSSTYTSTIYVIGGTNNMIAPLYTSPTIGTPASTITPGNPITLAGYAIALLPVQVIMNKQGDALNGKVVSATTTANGNGSWTLTLPTNGLSKGTYEIKALSQLSTKEQGLVSPSVYIGLGEDPNPHFSNRSDLNNDIKVNLTDLSILLFHWKTGDATADINQDGTVNLVDFSILLANWTG